MFDNFRTGMATGRSNLSKNWRDRPDQPTGPSYSESKATNNTFSRQYPSYSESRTTNNTFSRAQQSENGLEINPFTKSPKTIRGIDDSRSMQAIAEGRRLYVGNMPYRAKKKDVESLFSTGDYTMLVSFITRPWQTRHPDAHTVVSTLICLSTLSQAVILRTVLLSSDQKSRLIRQYKY